MTAKTGSRSIVLAGVLIAMLVVGFAATVSAQGDTVEDLQGVVAIQRDTVVVIVRGSEPLEPTNGAALLRAGLIEPGDIVTVRVVSDHGKKHKHYGHVTVLK